MNIVALTPGGARLAKRIREHKPKAALWLSENSLEETDSNANLCIWRPPLKEAFTRVFAAGQPIIFIGALGILVRLLAPLITDKRKDPPVVLVDEGGQFVISVLAGHWGGANDLAIEIARNLAATPVVTTATDVVGLPAVDVFARRYHAVPEPWGAIKQVSSGLLQGLEVEWFIEEKFLHPLQEIDCMNVPWEAWKHQASTKKLRVLLTGQSVESHATLTLYPQHIVAGVGCRKGIQVKDISQAIELAFQQVNIHPKCLTAITSAWVKSEEPALVEFARIANVPFKTFSADEIEQCCAQHPEIAGSNFVDQSIGVRAVCEPTALLAHPQARMILKKIVFGPVTIALAEVPWPLSDWDPVTAIK